MGAPTRTIRLRRETVALLFLIGTTVLAYSPSFPGEFLWDDDWWTIRLKPFFANLSDLGKMWTDFSTLQTYYPLTGTSFWIDYHLWGFRSFPYHVENVCLHVLAVVLLWRLLKRLQVPGALLGASIFAVHPMMVESVAWITERKNVLSMVLFLAALFSYGQFANFWQEHPQSATEMMKSTPHRWRWYTLGIILFVLACMAKTTVCTLPAVLLLLCWWRRGHLRWRTDILPTVPFFAIGLSSGVLIALLEYRHVGAHGPEWDFSIAQRCLIAGHAVGFYVGKLLWPPDVCFIYGRWPVDALSWAQWLWPGAVVGTLAVLWLLRGRIGRGPVAGCLYFIGTALPLLGLINSYGMRYSFVWDHWAYLPSLGLIVSFSAIATTLATHFLSDIVRIVLAVAVFVSFGFLTWRRAAIYQSDETLWRDTLKKNPTAWIASNYVGYYAYQKGAKQEAISCYLTSIAAHPNPEAYYNLANALALEGQIKDAISAYRQALNLNPNHFKAHMDLGTIFVSQGNMGEAEASYRSAVKIRPKNAYARWCLASVLERSARFPEAIGEYRESLRIEPGMHEALENLALILIRNSDATDRDRSEAVLLAERACQLTSFRQPHYLATLAMTYGEVGRFDEAARMAEQAASRAVESGDTEGAKVNHNLAEQYRSAAAGAGSNRDK